MENCILAGGGNLRLEGRRIRCRNLEEKGEKGVGIYTLEGPSSMQCRAHTQTDGETFCRVRLEEVDMEREDVSD